MVGIPGKSKGCHTCRRRKIRCSLEKPNCLRCIQSGKTCEGYERGAVFLNRTPQGWEKRTRLEETRPRLEVKQPSTLSISNDPTSPVQSSREESAALSEDQAILPLDQAGHPFNLLVKSPNVRKELFQNLFLENYLPSSPRSGTGLQGSWLFEALKLAKPGPALEYSLHALCVTRVGRIVGNNELIKRGNVAYGFALRALRTALESQKLAGRDETLASCLILSIYELYESTSNSTNAHEEHMAGIERLVQFRGPKQTDSILGRALLKNISYASMIKSLQYRRTSRLKYLIDKVQWWDMQGLLFAKGHTLGALMDDLDQYKQSGQHSIQASASYLKRCTDLDTDFEIWYEALLGDSPCPIHWTPHYPKPNGEDEIMFASLNLAHLTLDYWALRLILTTTIDIICSQIPPDIPPTVRSLITHLQSEHGKARQLELATDIMSSLPYCMSTEYGVSSSQKCLFSGRVALFCLRRYSSEQLPEYEGRYLDLTEKKGLKFAKDIDKKVMTEWSPHISEKATQDNT